MTTRRGFLGSILAAAVAPAIVRADSLMRIIPRETSILPADASVLRLVPAQGELMIQWVSEEPALGGVALRSQQYPSGAGGHFTVPEGVQSVWLTMYAAGGGGGNGIRNYGGGGAGGMITPTRDDRGNIYAEPMAVKPGQLFVFEKS